MLSKLLFMICKCNSASLTCFYARKFSTFRLIFFVLYLVCNRIWLPFYLVILYQNIIFWRLNNEINACFRVPSRIAAVGQVEGQGVSLSWPWVWFHSWYYVIPITVKSSQNLISPEDLNVMVCRISKTCIVTVEYEPTRCTIYFQFISVINLYVFQAGLLLIIRR